MGRRLREVEVMYVDDPTLDIGAEDSDDCPASPPPTYYLRVREEKEGQRPSADGSEVSGMALASMSPRICPTRMSNSNPSVLFMIVLLPDTLLL